MKNIVQGQIPADYRVDFEIPIFNGEAHRQQQSPTGWKSFHLIHESKKTILASAHFHLSGDLATTPYRAPFGSFDHSSNLAPSVLFEFIGDCENLLRIQKIKRIEIKHPPIHNHALNLVPVFLINLGYQVSSAEVGAFIQVDEISFAEKLDDWPARKYKQAHQVPLTFKVLENKSVDMVYDFIHEARVERGFGLSMNKKDLIKTVKACKSAFHCFGIFQKKEMVAAAISIRASKNVLYNFYLAHSKRTDKFSPVIILIDGIYNWCRERNIGWLDLGTSALDESPNFSLLEFKLRLGAVPVAKLTFTKKLE